MTAAEQLAEIAAKSDAMRNVTVRQVADGFIINANTTYAEKGTGAVLAQISHETIAGDAAAAVTKVGSYLDTGAFA